MERHKCKLCSRTFANGRALGGHMKAHLATLPLPPKPQPLPSESSSFSYSSSESGQQELEEEQAPLGHSHRESEEKGVVYGLRENPKKSFRVADPGFSVAAAPDTGSVVVQDRESETESKNPTRQRSKRNRKSRVTNQNSEEEEEEEEEPPKKPKLSFMESPPPPPQPEPEPVVSSVSDTTSIDDVAMFLVMLSRDTSWWNKNVAVKQDQHQEQEQELEVERSVVGSKGGGGGGGGCNNKGINFKRVRGKHQCEKCGKTFRSSRALGSHRSICCRGNESARGEGGDRVFECPFCSKVFGSGQALGGHKRSHLMGMASSSSTANDSARLNNSRESFIDLNLPAPAEEEEDDLGVVSDVSDA